MCTLKCTCILTLEKLKTQSCHDANFVVTDQWWQSWYHDNSGFSVNQEALILSINQRNTSTCAGQNEINRYGECATNPTWQWQCNDGACPWRTFLTLPSWHPIMLVKLRQLTWSDTSEQNLQVPYLQTSCNVLINLQGTSLVVPIMLTRGNMPIG